MSDDEETTASDGPTATVGPGVGSIAETLSSGAIIDDRFKLDLAARCPQFDTLGGEAFAAQDLDDPGNPVYAFICRPGVPLRLKTIESLRGQAVPHLAGVLTLGLIPTTDDGERQALVVSRPLGGALTWSADKPSARFSETDARNVFLPQMLDILDALFGRGQTHRRIHPSNIFYQDAEKGQLVLGECVSEPPGVSQPAVFESLERAMAMPVGRGDGTPADDLYALGVTLYYLLRGGDPLKGVADQKIMRSRLSKGTWTTLGGASGIPVGFASALQGLLADDLRVRWNLKELQSWLAGTAPKARATSATITSSSPLKYSGREIPNSRALAYALGANPAQGLRKIKEKNFARWVSGLRDAPATEKLEALTVNISAGGRAVRDMFLLARVCLLLDPSGPLRLGPMAFFPDGLGPVVAGAYKKNNSAEVQILTEGMGSGLVAEATVGDDRPTSKRVQLEAVRIQEIVARDAPGQGLERALYELCPGFPCQSPLVKKRSAMSLDSLMNALELAAANPIRATELLDRHLTGFIARQSTGLQFLVDRLRSTGDSHSAVVLATLDVLEAVQRQHTPAPLPILSGMICKELEIVVGRIHGKKRREIMIKQLTTLSKSGDLGHISRTLDLRTVLKRDEAEYQNVVVEFANNEILRSKLGQNLLNRHQRAETSGHAGVAAIGAILLALVVGYFVIGGGS
jgi:eukaryotic-like serine/threonine-protein kinase